MVCFPDSDIDFFDIFAGIFKEIFLYNFFAKSA